MADDRYPDEELDALLAEYDLIRQKKKAGSPQTATDATVQAKPAATVPQQKRPAQPTRPGTPSAKQTGKPPVNRPRQQSTQTKTPTGSSAEGTAYSLEELNQIQASRQAMYNRQKSPPPQPQNEKARQSAAFDAAYRQQNPGQRKPVYRHRKPAKPNGGLVLFALLVLTIGAVSLGQIVENRRESAETTPLTVPVLGETPENRETLDTTDDETAAEEMMILWNTTEVDNRLVGTGDLILVNYQYPYAAADTITVTDVYGNRNGYYQVSNTSIALTQTALDAMNAMTDGFYRVTHSDDMMIVSGYRNVQSQRDIYNDRVATQGEEMAALYVATPGYSEHHTGLAMDLSFYTDEGVSVNIEQYEHGSWLNENCTRYGFVLRYPSDKIDITKIGYEFWHYRYVGIPHAQIMTEKNLCLEEYITFIKEYTPSTKLLWVQENGQLTDVSVTALPSSGTLVYYVPTDGDSTTTEIRIPRGNLFGNTRISGNNVDGFIVTVPIGS